MNNSIKAVIFDWAGTLIDFGCMAPVSVFIKVFKEYGVDLSPDLARRPMGLAKMDHLRILLTYKEVESSWLEVHGALPGESMILDMYMYAEKIMEEVVIQHAVPIPGAAALMGRLRKQNISTGSTTGYSESIIRPLLLNSSLAKIIPDCVVTSTDTPQGRPKPWMCFLNAQLLDVFPMHNLVKIGDTRADIEEGINAGMWTIGLTLSGNEAGLSKDEYERMSVKETEDLHGHLKHKLTASGAHYTAKGIWDCDNILEEIDQKIQNGERP